MIKKDERPTQKSVDVDIFNDINISNSVLVANDISNQATQNEITKCSNQLDNLSQQQCKTSDFHQQFNELRDFQQQAVENVNNYTQLDPTTCQNISQEQEISVISAEQQQQINQPRYSLRDSFNRISELKNENHNTLFKRELSTPTIDFISSPLIQKQIKSSQYHVIKLFQENSEFQAIIIQQIKQNGLYLLKFTPQTVQTLKKYNLPFDIDYSIITEDKQFIIIASYSQKQVALFDVNFFDPIIVKSYEFTVQTKIQDIILYKNNIFLATRNEIHAISLKSLELLTSLKIELKNDEFVEYFLLGQHLALTTTTQIFYFTFQHNVIDVKQQFAWAFSDGITLAETGLLCNIKQKLYFVDLKTKQKQCLNDRPVKLVQTDIYSLFGLNSQNKLWRFTYRNADFKVSQRQIGSQNIAFMKIQNGLVFWISEQGLYGTDMLQQYVV
ncbi:hypothetical protein SS50377_21038 [Spironucleus salmonicida]|nr:hypothetical protein SS50377_21038 [Spironucleus salmonicida]